MHEEVIVGDARLILGGCLEILPTLPKVDAVVTDPPYFGVKQDEWDNQWRSETEFLEWVSRVLVVLRATMAFNGSLYWFTSPQMSSLVEQRARQEFTVLNNIVWNKSGARKGAAGTGIDVTALRAFWTANTERLIFAEQKGSDISADDEVGYVSACEATKQRLIGAYLRGEFDRAGITNKQVAALFPSKTGGFTGCVSNWLLGANIPTKPQYEAMRKFLNSHGDGDYLKREYEDLKREYEGLRRPFNAEPDDQWGDIWDFPIERDQKHPTQKPIRLIEHIAKISSKRSQTILDPFMGSGTTGVACANLGRKFIGIEIERKYFDIACERIAAAYAQGRLFA